MTEQPATADQFAEWAAQALAGLDTFQTPETPNPGSDLADLAALIREDTER